MTPPTNREEGCGCDAHRNGEDRNHAFADCPHHKEEPQATIPDTGIEGWEKEFDDRFPYIGADEQDFAGTLEKNELKDFIRAHSSHLHSSIHAEIEGMRPNKEAIGDAPGDNAVGSEQRAFGANSIINRIMSLPALNEPKI